MTIIETATDRCTRLALDAPSALRLVSLDLASPLVDDETFVLVANANRCSRSETIILPAGRYEGLSRGKGWCRLGKGVHAEWGERTDKGYRVAKVGTWLIHATDGYSRHDELSWDVSRITVGNALWTLAV